MEEITKLQERLGVLKPIGYDVDRNIEILTNKKQQIYQEVFQIETKLKELNSVVEKKPKKE